MENIREQSEGKAHENWTHVGTRATPEEKNGERDSRYWFDDAIEDTGSLSKNYDHESEELTNCCAGTFRQGRQVRVVDSAR